MLRGRLWLCIFLCSITSRSVVLRFSSFKALSLPNSHCEKFQWGVQNLPQCLLKHRGSYFWGSPMHSSPLFFCVLASISSSPCLFSALCESLSVAESKLMLDISHQPNTEESIEKQGTQVVIFRFSVIAILLPFGKNDLYFNFYFAFHRKKRVKSHQWIPHQPDTKMA